MSELYKKYRPTTLQRVVGQKVVVDSIKKMAADKKIPHAILLHGPSGCGKTTIARILKGLLDCSDHDFDEVNCANFRGIDKVREIQARVGLHPLGGSSRVWLIDECHRLTGEAQDAFLKLLEDPPKHCFFLLATTDPKKLNLTVRNRCTSFELKPVSEVDLEALINSVLKREKVSLDSELVAAIAESADRSPRRCLVNLELALAAESPEAAMQIIKAPAVQEQGIMIARALFNQQTNWASMAKILRAVDEDAESLRWMVLAYATKLALSGHNAARAVLVINAFRDNWYDCKQAGLVAACWEVVGVKGK
jgi:DNA polymerase III gamma/tau subunit